MTPLTLSAFYYYRGRRSLWCLLLILMYERHIKYMHCWGNVDDNLHEMTFELSLFHLNFIDVYNEEIIK